MMTRAELAFSALDKDGSGFISSKELKKLSTKLTEEELQALMAKVNVTLQWYNVWELGFISA